MQFNNGTNALLRQGQNLTSTNRWAMASTLTAQWNVVNPKRVPEVSAARDAFEKAKNQYLIALRELRLRAYQAYFKVQWGDEKLGGATVSRCFTGQSSGCKGSISGRSCYKIEVLQAETQLGRDRYLLDDNLIFQSLARRELARVLNLPQTVSPTATEPLKIIGLWKPSSREYHCRLHISRRA